MNTDPTPIPREPETSEPSLRPAYLWVVVTEILVILGLWLLGRAFSG